MKKWLLVACTLGLYACGEGKEPPGEDEARLELGTGSWRFEPLTDGQDVELVHGAQGGWHAWISLRVTGARVDHPSMLLSMEPVDESLPRQDVSVALSFEPPDEQGAQKLIGYTGVVNDPSCWVDALVRVAVTVTTDDGTVLSDEHDVVLRGGAYPPPPCATP
jgi:hypothetical protein